MDRPYIVLAWDPPESARSGLAHEYVHWVFKDSVQPLWYREGLAEYLSQSVLLSNGAVFGIPPARFLAALLREPWIPLRQLMTAKRERDLLTSPTFYEQWWLIAHWLGHSSQPAAEARKGPRGVPRHETFVEFVDREGEEAAEAELREYLKSLVSGKAVTTAMRFESANGTSFAVRETEEWELPYYLADACRETPAWDKAETELKRLQQAFPSRPEPSESLGALQMDRNDYEAAEQTLASAVAKGSVNPRTYHRYSLLLLRPVEGGPVWARQRAAWSRDHARKALDIQRSEPAYILTEAQASGLLGEWQAATAGLAELASYPEWRERAEKEFDVLLHRRRQFVMNLPQPAPDAPKTKHIDLAPLGSAPERVAKPRPPPKQAELWPPPGTVLLYGHIVRIDCLTSEKIVTVRTPRWKVRLRERAEAPAQLISPPRNWRALPCEAGGWGLNRELNVAFRPDVKDRGVWGELVAVVF